MSHAALYTADSFTATRFAGNPAGVVMCDHALPPAVMQTIAGELYLETAFLSPSTVSGADYAVAYYTGAARIPFCGHDTVAAAASLVHSGHLSAPGTVRFAADNGIVPVIVGADGDITFTLPPPVLGPVWDAAPFVEALGIASSLVLPVPVQSVNTGGTLTLLLGITDEKTLHALRPDMARLAALQTAPGAPGGLYVWALAGQSFDVNVHARCFCPGEGLPEDPVTGSASAAFGAYAVHHNLLPHLEGARLAFRTEQGRAMGRTGHVCVSVECTNNAITQVQVTGQAVIISQGTLFL